MESLCITVASHLQGVSAYDERNKCSYHFYFAPLWDFSASSDKLLHDSLVCPRFAGITCCIQLIDQACFTERDEALRPGELKNCFTDLLHTRLAVYLEPLPGRPRGSRRGCSRCPRCDEIVHNLEDVMEQTTSLSLSSSAVEDLAVGNHLITWDRSLISHPSSYRVAYVKLDTAGRYDNFSRDFCVKLIFLTYLWSKNIILFTLHHNYLFKTLMPVPWAQKRIQNCIFM